MLLPLRIANEDLGDHLEKIQRMYMQGRPAWMHVQIRMAMFWTGVSAVGYYRKNISKTSPLEVISAQAGILQRRVFAVPVP